MRAIVMGLLVVAALGAGCGGSDGDDGADGRTTATQERVDAGSYERGQTCRPEKEQEYRAAGFTCQATGAESCIYTDFGTTCVPIHALFPVNDDGTLAGAPEKPAGVDLEAAATSVIEEVAKDEKGRYRATCHALSEDEVTCTFRGTGADKGCTGVAVARDRGGEMKVEPSAGSGCDTGGPSRRLTAEAPDAAVSDWLGTYVCLTGVVAQVRPAGPTEIAPIPIPESVLYYPPLKFTLRPDGTYSNITYGNAYEGDPLWEGIFRVSGDQVSLYSPPDYSMFPGYPFVHRIDADGTHYLIGDVPENERVGAFACRQIA